MSKTNLSVSFIPSEPILVRLRMLRTYVVFYDSFNRSYTFLFHSQDGEKERQ